VVLFVENAYRPAILPAARHPPKKCAVGLDMAVVEARYYSYHTIPARLSVDHTELAAQAAGPVSRKECMVHV
jgi:hypothetical protein